MTSAGALWRDEAAAVGLATMPTFKEVVAYFHHEAFPLLFPILLRALSFVFGGTDLAYRVFGMTVGVGIIAALWLTSSLTTKRVPLISLALLGFNAAFIQWGDSVRGYGLGTLLIILALGLVWRAGEAPRPFWIACAAAVAVASVQCLFHNAPLLLAMCGGAAVVWVRRGDARRALVVLGIGLVAALSLVPYWGALHRGRSWDAVVRVPVAFGEIWAMLVETLTGTAWSHGLICFTLLVLACFLCILSQSRRCQDFFVNPHLVLFCAVTLLLAIAGCLSFLRFLSYAPRPWYFLALFGCGAACLDVLFSACRPRWVQRARLILALLLAVSALPFAWGQVKVRQTSVDAVAAKLQSSATRHDLILISSWPIGISFERYYRGEAPWLTLPGVDFHRFHRYDIIQTHMSSADQTAPVRHLLQRSSATLQAGGKVWVVGPCWPSKLEPGDTRVISSSGHAWDVWAEQVWGFLREAGGQMKALDLNIDGPVNSFENPRLTVIQREGPTRQ